MAGSACHYVLMHFFVMHPLWHSAGPELWAAKQWLRAVPRFAQESVRTFCRLRLLARCVHRFCMPPPLLRPARRRGAVLMNKEGLPGAGSPFAPLWPAAPWARLILLKAQSKAFCLSQRGTQAAASSAQNPPHREKYQGRNACGQKRPSAPHTAVRADFCHKNCSRSSFAAACFFQPALCVRCAAQHGPPAHHTYHHHDTTISMPERRPVKTRGTSRLAR